MKNFLTFAAIGALMSLFSALITLTALFARFGNIDALRSYLGL